MRTDLRPRCPEHRSDTMVRVELWLGVDAHEHPVPTYACPEPNCPYHYNVIHGYFRTQVGSRIERDMRFWQNCTHDGLPMFIQDFDPQGNSLTWKCGQLGCIGSGRTEGV